MPTKTIDIGSRIPFYDVALRKKVTRPVDKFITRKIGKTRPARTVTIAVGETTDGRKLYRIISNEA